MKDAPEALVSAMRDIGRAAHMELNRDDFKRTPGLRNCNSIIILLVTCDCAGIPTCFAGRSNWHGPLLLHVFNVDRHFKL